MPPPGFINGTQPIDVANLQEIPRKQGFNAQPKGLNEFVLYGEDYMSEDLGLKVSIPFYYLYTSLSFDNGRGGLITEEGSMRGLIL